MSQRQIDRFNANSNGIKFITAEGSGIKIGGIEFKRPIAVEFDGREIPPSQFRYELNNTPGVKSAMYSAYNWRFLNKSYKPFLKFAGVFGFSKAPTFDPNDTDEERNKKLKATANHSESIDGTLKPKQSYPDPCDSDCKTDIDNQNKQIEDENKIKQEAQKAADSGKRAFKPGIGQRLLGRASGLLWAVEACQIPYAIGAISMGAKVKRSQQLVRYASMFLVMHSVIKAGDADPGSVSFLADKITKTFVDEEGNVSKPGTEGFVYGYANHEATGMTESATLATVGGHIGGPAAGVAAEFSKPHYKNGCNIATNPATLVGVMLLSIVPGVKAANVTFRAGAQMVIQRFVSGMFKGAVVGYGLNQAINYFVQLAIDATVGEIVDDETYGELAMDLAGSGIIETYSKAGMAGGGLALTPEQAVTFNSEVNQTYLAQYAEYDRKTHSPLDTSNPNTVMGSIYGSIMPHMVLASSSATGMLSVLQRLAFGIPSLFGPKTAKAVTTDEYTQCLDYQYQELGIATTPMCHVIVGIPPSYLNIEPNDVIDYLISVDDIDEEGNIQADYADFIDECFGATPLQDKSECIADPDSDDYKQRVYRALFYVDESIEDVFINGLPEQEAINQVGSRTPPAGEPGRFDDTSLSCPEGTTDDLGVITTRYAGPLTESKYPKIRVCRIHGIPGFGVVPKGEIREVNTGAVVNAAVAPMFVQLVEDYNNLPESEKSKINLRANSSFRLQDSCEIATPGAQCADPGLSNHQLGTGIDFALSDGTALSYPLPSCVGRITSVDPTWKFLNTYGPKHGIKQLSHENWHWEAGTKGEHLCPA